MGRTYAGILGPLAFGLVTARGVISGAGTEGTVLAASAALFVFAALGYMAGRLAEYLVNESVRGQFQAAMLSWELKDQQLAKTQPKPTT